MLFPLDVQFLLLILVHPLDSGALISRPGRLCCRRRWSVARQGGLSRKLFRRPSSGGLGLRGVIGQGYPRVEAQAGQSDSGGSNRFHRAPPMTRRRQCCRRLPPNARAGRLCLAAGEFRRPRSGTQALLGYPHQRTPSAGPVTSEKCHERSLAERASERNRTAGLVSQSGARILTLRIPAWMPPSVSVNPPSAKTSVPSRTPAGFSAHMADGGPGDADTTNSCPERSAAEGDLRDHAVRLVNWRNCHCLC